MNRTSERWGGRPTTTLRDAPLLILMATAVACSAGESPGADDPASARPSERVAASHLIEAHGELAFELARGGLRAELTYRLVPGAAELAFLLNADLTADVSGDAVQGWQRASSEMNPAWDRLLVQVRPGFEHQLANLDFVVEGQPRLPDSGINQIGSDWVELGVDAMWHPLIETIDREFVVDLELHLPADWTVVASGEVVAGDGVFMLESPIPQVDMAFTAAPGLERSSQGSYVVFHRGAGSAAVERLLRRANDCRVELDRRFGQGDPLPRGRFVMAERREGGYARKNYVVLTDVTDRSDAALTDFLCHELAHYWSSGAPAFSADNWLNEGFATLVGAQSVRSLVGADAYAAMLSELEERASGLGSVWTPDDLSRRSYAVQYKKAPTLLLRLEEKIGAILFERLVRDYMAGIDSTPALLNRLAELTDEPTRRWFEELLAADGRESA